MSVLDQSIIDSANSLEYLLQYVRKNLSQNQKTSCKKNYSHIVVQQKNNTLEHLLQYVRKNLSQNQKTSCKKNIVVPLKDDTS